MIDEEEKEWEIAYNLALNILSKKTLLNYIKISLLMQFFDLKIQSKVECHILGC